MGFRPLHLLFLSFFFSWSRGDELRLAVTGSDVTFIADVSEEPSEITWYKDKSKIVDLEKGKPPDFYNLHDRVSADLETGTFILQRVTPADNALYKAERLVKGKLLPVFFTLKVYDEVCQVGISDTTVENNVTLRCACSGPGPQPSKYEWYNPTSAQRVSTNQNITVQKENTAQSYRCEASNEVSKNHANTTVLERTQDKEKTLRTFIITIMLLVLYTVFLLILIVLYKYNKLPCLIPSRNNGAKDEEQKLNQVTPEGAKDEEKKLNQVTSEGAKDEEQKLNQVTPEEDAQNGENGPHTPHTKIPDRSYGLLRPQCTMDIMERDETTPAMGPDSPPQ